MRTQHRVKRQGKVIVLVAMLVPVMAGMGAFGIDVGKIELARSEVQAGADAAALATVEELPGDQATLDSVALMYAQFNVSPGVNVQVTVEGGTWNDETTTFTSAPLSQANAVRVTVNRPETDLYFGNLFGKAEVALTASAIALRPSGIGTRFLIDEDMFDKDMPAIENLANSLGVDPEELVTPAGFNDGKLYGANDWTWSDNFLDIPPGSTLSLPTGQGTDYENNDAGLFDLDNPEFPFTDDESFMDFLMYSETGNDDSKWGTDTSSVLNQLDPLVGASPVTDDSTYDSFVSPDFIHVSPVTFSDISTLNMENGVPQLNAKGLRRGLIAFKITEVGQDVDGNGSVLPELVIVIVDPSTILPSDIKPAGQGGGGKVRLVK